MFFFDGWYGVARVIVVGSLAYVALVLVLRITGKRTLSKLNAFDLVVTVALGSTLATAILSKQTPLAEGVTALALLVGLQYVVTWLSVRSETVDRLVKAEPVLLFYKGKFLRDAMKKERVTEGEVRAAVRETSMGSLDQVEAVVLETAATITAIPSGPGEGWLLKGVIRPEAAPPEVAG